MPWIESHSELRDHPKAKRMKRKLRISEHETVGLLHYFWYWALEFASDGDITNLSDEDIADGCRFTGEPEEFVSALIHAGFVDEVDGIRTIHDWFKHAGKLISWRQKEAERARVNREKNGKKPVNTDSVQRTEDVRTEDDLRTNRGTYVPVTVTDTKDLKHIGDSNECALAFETFWKVFPNKKGKEKARVSWVKLWKQKKIDMEHVISGTIAYEEHVKHKQLKKPDFEFCYGSTFVNQLRWNDDWSIEADVRKFSKESEEYIPTLKEWKEQESKKQEAMMKRAADI